MKQVAKVACQVRRKSGKLITLNRYDVIDYDGEHTHLRPIATPDAPQGVEPIDFDTAREDELFEAQYNLEDLKDYIRATYDVPVRVKAKKRLIEKLLDCRYRALSPSDTNRLG